MNQKILSDKEINTGRQHELDLARAVVIFCLPFIHCFIECTPESGLDGGIPYLFDTIIGGSFSAPMYMFVMGVGMIYTRKNSPLQHIVRGLKILIAGYVLNICRFLIPYMIGYSITGDYDHYIEQLMYKVLGNDILVFAGLAMILIGLMLKANISKIMMLAIAAVLTVLGTLLNGVDVHSPFGNIFLGYLIGTEDAAGLVISDFPVFNWLIFPVFGYVFGAFLRKVQNKKKLYTMISIPSLIIVVVYYIIGIRNETGMFGEGQNCYYHMIVSDVAASLLLTIGMIGVYYALFPMLPDKLKAIATDISSNITSVYCIHWVIIGFIINLYIYVSFGTQILSTGACFILSLCISIVSIIIAHYFNIWRKRAKRA